MSQLELPGHCLSQIFHTLGVRGIGDFVHNPPATGGIRGPAKGCGAGVRERGRGTVGAGRWDRGEVDHPVRVRKAEDEQCGSKVCVQRES